MYKNFTKRLLDIFISFIGIIVLLLPMAIIVLAIRVNSKGPAIFKQKRVGKDKRLFNIYKFRTMYLEAPHETATHDLHDPDKWITPVGSFLRKTSLDELPQIFNIFFGQMSIVGPRPTLWNEDDIIAEREKYGVNSVKPGLTGWAQINGRDALDTETKAKYDAEYIKKCSFLFDAKCFFLTVPYVLGQKDVVEGDKWNEAEEVPLGEIINQQAK